MSLSHILARRLDHEKTVRAGFAVALLAIMAIAAFSYYVFMVLERSAGLIDHTHEVQINLAEADAVYSRARTRWRVYVTDGNPAALAGYMADAAALPDRIANLAILVSDNPEQLRRAETLREMIAAEFASTDQLVARKRAGELEDKAEIFSVLSRSRPAVARINSLLQQMADAEELLLSYRRKESQRQSTLARLVVGVGTTLSVAMLLFAYYLLMRQMHQLREAQQSIGRLNAQLQKRSESLEASNKELESFSYSVSHDLRAPLRAISGYARMLEEDQGPRLDDDGRRHLAVVCAEADRMGLLIDDLLAFSRLGREPVKAGLTDMDALVREIVDEVRRTAPPALSIEAAPLPAARGDRALLRQVWINLISNAVKYSGKCAQPQVRISGLRDGDRMIYRIEDNGAGFDMRYYDKLFGVFQRLHSMHEFPGTGIGLAIVQRVVSRHGGRVWAEGEPGRGAVFYFSLPVESDSREQH